jgi:hypothetical protein
LVRTCHLRHVTEGKTEGRIGITGRRHKQQLNDLKEMREYSKLKEEALDCTLCRSHFVRGYRPVRRQAMEQMKEI